MKNILTSILIVISISCFSQSKEAKTTFENCGCVIYSNTTYNEFDLEKGISKEDFHKSQIACDSLAKDENIAIEVIIGCGKKPTSSYEFFDIKPIDVQFFKMQLPKKCKNTQLKINISTKKEPNNSTWFIVPIID